MNVLCQSYFYLISFGFFIIVTRSVFFLSALQDPFISLIENFIISALQFPTSGFIQISARISTISISRYHLCMVSCRENKTASRQQFYKKQSTRPVRYQPGHARPEKISLLRKYDSMVKVSDCGLSVVTFIIYENFSDWLLQEIHRIDRRTIFCHGKIQVCPFHAVIFGRF